MDVQFEEDNIAKNYSNNRQTPQMQSKSLSRRDKMLIVIGVVALILAIYLII